MVSFWTSELHAYFANVLQLSWQADIDTINDRAAFRAKMQAIGLAGITDCH